MTHKVDGHSVPVTSLQIRDGGTQGICGKQFFGRNGNGYLARGTVCETYYRRTHQYRFEQRNSSQIERFNQWNDPETSVIISSVPQDDPDRPGRVIYLHVREYIRRRRAHVRTGQPLNCLFAGGGGMAVWYIGDGGKRVTHPILDDIWDQIEDDLPQWNGRREVIEEWGHPWPHKRVFDWSDYRNALVIRTNDLTDQQVAELTEPHVIGPEPLVLDGDPAVLKVRIRNGRITSDPRGTLTTQEEAASLKVEFDIAADKQSGTATQQLAERLREINWRTLPGVNEADVLDPRKKVRLDLARTYDRTTEVQTRTRS